MKATALTILLAVSTTGCAMTPEEQEAFGMALAAGLGGGALATMYQPTPQRYNGYGYGSYTISNPYDFRQTYNVMPNGMGGATVINPYNIYDTYNVRPW